MCSKKWTLQFPRNCKKKVNNHWHFSWAFEFSPFSILRNVCYNGNHAACIVWQYSHHIWHRIGFNIQPLKDCLYKHCFARIVEDSCTTLVYNSWGIVYSFTFKFSFIQYPFLRKWKEIKQYQSDYSSWRIVLYFNWMPLSSKHGISSKISKIMWS